jgi:hypothetical protein
VPGRLTSRLAFAAFCAAIAARAREISIVSAFERFDAYGKLSAPIAT